MDGFVAGEGLSMKRVFFVDVIVTERDLSGRVIINKVCNFWVI